MLLAAITNETLMISPAQTCALLCLEETCLRFAVESCRSVPVPLLNTTGSGGSLLPKVNVYCLRVDGVHHNLSGFDNFAMSVLTIFVSTTLEGWTEIMYQLHASWGAAWFTTLFFLLLIMIGAFFLTNLALAVVWYVLAVRSLRVAS